MKLKLNKGSSSFEGLVILIGLCIVLFIFILPTRKLGPTANIYNFGTNTNQNPFPTSEDPFVNSKNPFPNHNGDTSATVYSSAYAREIRVGSGNASSAYQPYEEYINIYNGGNESIAISGWVLKNDKDKRAYELGGTLRYFPADTAVIPSGTSFIAPKGSSSMGPIVLGPSESAIVTTGKINSTSPYKIVSFKENKCSGYLGNMPEYTFTPPLNQQCPDPADEAGVKMLDQKCKNFINRLSSCRIPEFGGKDAQGQRCSSCVDGVELSSSCTSFIKSHYNYGSCVANHSNDSDFFLKTWRIFLNQTWQMWGEEDETIYLLDSSGKLVDSDSY